MVTCHRGVSMAMSIGTNRAIDQMIRCFIYGGFTVAVRLIVARLICDAARCQSLAVEFVSGMEALHRK